MDERLPPELFTKSGKRRPLQIKKIKYLFPELWERVFKFVDGRFFFVANKKYFNENDVDSKHVLLRETCPRIFDVSGRDKTTRFAWDCGDYIFLINDDLQ